MALSSVGVCDGSEFTVNMRIEVRLMMLDWWDYWAIRVWQDRQFALQIGRAVGCVPAVRIPPAPAFTLIAHFSGGSKWMKTRLRITSATC